MKLTVHSDAGGFLDAAEKPLLADEARNNLILGIADRVRCGRSYGDESPYFLTVEEDGALVAAAIRTPPFPLIVSCVEDRLDALELLVDHLRAADPDLPGVNGEARAAAAFANRWTERSSGLAEVGMRMRVYALHEVDPPIGVPGRMRLARAEDVDLIAEWTLGFHEEAVPGDPPSDPRENVCRFMESGTMAVWDYGGPVSMAGSSRGSKNGTTVSAVYTPPMHRRNGYASACVAALCQRLLDEGKAFCTLYADLANPTSNKIYQRIGFRPVADAAVYHFTPGAGT